MNLGWKLAQVVNGTSPVSLLDTYQAERHPVGARVLQNTMAQRAVGATDERTGALRDLLAVLLTMEEPRKHIAGMISGLDIHYDLGEGHPLLGRRMPDLDLATADGPVRVFTLLHDARPVLLNLGDAGGSTSHRGPTASSSSTPPTPAPGSSRCSARWRRRRPCWSGRTDTSPGSGTARMRDCAMR